MSTEIKNNCPICQRELIPGDSINDHHLIPKCKNGKDDDKVTLHKICHNKIHSVWSESELKNYYHTIERIVNHDEIQKFIKWVRKKPPEFYIKTKLHGRRKR